MKFWIMVGVISVRAEVSESRAPIGASAPATELASLASTVTSSATLPRARVTGTSMGEPSASRIPFFWLVLNPLASTCTVYLPAVRLAKAYLPWPSEVVFSVAPVASLRTWTAAPGSGTPRGSRTVPLRAALDWARAAG